MSSASVLDTLAAAYASNGQFDKASFYEEQAAAKAESPEQKKKFAERLQLYQQKKPYIEPALPVARPPRLMNP